MTSRRYILEDHWASTFSTPLPIQRSTLEITREEFSNLFGLNMHAELLSSTRALVAKTEQDTIMTDRVKGLQTSIDSKRPPKNFKDAMSREDRQEWAEAYDNERVPSTKLETPKITESSAKVLGSATRPEYKVLKKRKI